MVSSGRLNVIQAENHRFFTKKIALDHLGLFSWCWLIEIFQTLDIDKIDSYKLHGLVDILGLQSNYIQASPRFTW